MALRQRSTSDLGSLNLGLTEKTEFEILVLVWSVNYTLKSSNSVNDPKNVDEPLGLGLFESCRTGVTQTGFGSFDP